MSKARDLAEELYRSFKSQVLWKDVDFKRIDKFEKIIKRKFALDLDAQVKKAVEEQIVAVEKEPEEELIQIEHQTLLQRIIADQDNQFIQDIIQSEATEEKPVVEQFNTIVEGATEKRYHIKITCTGIKKKPNFQVFKGTDVVEKDFRTDAILSHKFVYYAFVDTFDKKEIEEVVPEYFINAYISDVYETTFDSIPANYKSIWQNRTKL